jgi:enoyl-CoA hydratase/carnithine racemase
MTQTARVLAHDEGHVRVLTLNRPERRNALDLALASELRTRLDEATAASEVRCVLIAVRAHGARARDGQLLHPAALDRKAARE